MAKKEGWKKGEGPYSGSDDLNLVKKDPNKWATTDRSKTVDSNSERSDGFAAKLTPTDE